MSRQTITISDEIWIALKETSIKRKKPIGQIIEESLLDHGIKTRKNALEHLIKPQQQIFALLELATSPRVTPLRLKCFQPSGDRYRSSVSSTVCPCSSRAQAETARSIYTVFHSTTADVTKFRSLAR